MCSATTWLELGLGVGLGQLSHKLVASNPFGRRLGK